MPLSIEIVNELRVVRSVGKIKSYDAFLTFKVELEDMLPQILSNADATLRIYFVQAYPINSYVLGFLFKLRNIDRITIEIIVDDLRMFMFFEEIDMIDEFKIKIMEA